MKDHDSERIGEKVRIYKRGDQYWANLQHCGRQLRKSPKTNNVKIARGLALAWEQKVLSGSTSMAVPTEPPTVIPAGHAVSPPKTLRR